MLALMKTIFAGESLEMISRLLMIPTTDGRLLLPPPWPCMATKGLDKGDQGGGMGPSKFQNNENKFVFNKQAIKVCASYFQRCL